jgi:spore coat polysaccharide biosynthesis protein SpsF
MRIGIIIQARMGSQRFPGKVLHRVAGKPMLEYLLERLARCQTVTECVVATSDNDQDLPLVRFCESRRIPWRRGPLENVAERFRQVMEDCRFDAFVRVNGDSPLLDQAIVDRAVTRFREGDAEIVTNVLQRTFPKGQSVEVVNSETYRRGLADVREEADREHVTRFFYRERDRFRIVNIRSARDDGGVQLSVDTPEDMDRFAAIVGRMGRPHWEYGLDEILQFYRRGTDS